MASKLSVLGRNIGGVKTEDLSDVTGPFEWREEYGTGLTNLGLNIQQKDWQTILGSLARREDRQKISMVLAATAGAIAATITFTCF